MPVYEQDFPGALRAVAIFGPGLIGGSLGLALSKRSPATEVRYWTRPSSLDRVRAVFPGAASDAAAVTRGAEAVVFCTPVGAMPALASEVRGAAAPGAVFTDAGSTKAGIAARLAAILGPRYVPAHPMAGSEESGTQAAREDLFEGALCLLTPCAGADPSATERVAALWQSVGCRILQLDAAWHDRLVARASHLPHAVAVALMNAVQAGMPDALPVAATGFRDTTRIAAGSASMWCEILIENREEVLGALGEFSAAVAAIETALRDGDARALFEHLSRAQAAREALP